MVNSHPLIRCISRPNALRSYATYAVEHRPPPSRSNKHHDPHPKPASIQSCLFDHIPKPETENQKSLVYGLAVFLTGWWAMSRRDTLSDRLARECGQVDDMSTGVKFGKGDGAAQHH
ncbi:hypothetical protein JCM11641_000582 [Rhodosporidiobolus odoratus]